MATQQEFLSQDEVDALLKGVNGEAEEAKEDADPNSIRPYNLATQARIVRGRMPTLGVINARFARQFRVGLFNFMRRTADISAGPIRVLKYNDFIRNLVVPTNLNLVQAKPLRGTALFILDPDLVYLVVDNMFGGDGRFHTRVEGRDFTLTEQRIIQSLLAVIFSEYEKSWKPVFELKFEYMRSEMNTQFANIATPNEVVVVTTFTIDLGRTSGEFHVCMPYAMIEPVRDLLNSRSHIDRLEVDKRWLRLLTAQVQTAEVEMIATLGRAEVSLKQILHMKAGDVIAINIPPAITATVDGVAVMECRYGLSNGQYALKVEKILAGAFDE